MNKRIFWMKLKGLNVFLGAWENEQDIEREFSLTDGELNGAFILLAHYDIDGYEGSAFVLFERDGQLYEVNGGHCSCMGLEGQWSPEETSVDELTYRVKNGRLGWGYYDTDSFANQISEVLGIVA